jgi:preprotein translocase subunit SecG
MMRLRLVLAFFGIALAIAAIARDDRRIAWMAMVVLAVSMVLRIVARKAGNRQQS